VVQRERHGEWNGDRSGDRNRDGRGKRNGNGGRHRHGHWHRQGDWNGKRGRNGHRERHRNGDRFGHRERGRVQLHALGCRHVVGAVHDRRGVRWDVVAVSSTATGAMVFESELGTSGNFQPGTYSTSNVVLATGTSANLSTGAVWELQHNNNSNPNPGSFTLTISSTGQQIASGSSDAWEQFHGSLQMSIIPSPNGTGATGTITAEATF